MWEKWGIVKLNKIFIEREVFEKGRSLKGEMFEKKRYLRGGEGVWMPLGYFIKDRAFVVWVGLLIQFMY